MTECAHTERLQSLMYLCIDQVACVESVSYLQCCPLSVILNQFVWISSATVSGRDRFLSLRFWHHSHTSSSLDLRLFLFSLTADRYLSTVFLPVSADIVLPLVVIQNYQLSFVRPLFSVQPWHRGHTIEGGGWEGCWVGGAHSEQNDKSCFFRKMHIGQVWDFQPVYEYSMSLHAACKYTEGISHLAVVTLAWMVDVFHKGRVIVIHAHTFTDTWVISFSFYPLSHRDKHFCDNL